MVGHPVGRVSLNLRRQIGRGFSVRAGERPTGARLCSGPPDHLKTRGRTLGPLQAAHTIAPPIARRAQCLALRQFSFISRRIFPIGCLK